jgi:hypothetical protein
VRTCPRVPDVHINRAARTAPREAEHTWAAFARRRNARSWIATPGSFHMRAVPMRMPAEPK